MLVPSALFFDKDARYPCTISACKTWDDALSRALTGPELKVYCYWESKKVSTLLALHVSSGGQRPDLRLLPCERTKDPSGYEKFAEEHAVCLEERKAIVVKINDQRELLLAPVFSIQDDGSKLPVFWGYVLYFGVASVVSLMLDNSRMAVVLDLDETLLVANSQSTLDSKIETARKTRRYKANELADLLANGVTADSEEATRLRSAEAAAAKEEELLSGDLEMLRQFATTNTVTVDGKVHKAKFEQARLEDGNTIMRPVIRLEKPQPVMLTRIRPESRETSMILRPRPNWDELRGVLAGDSELGPDGKPKLRFDVYVCTAAERQYALEVWRLLDTRGNIIPVEQRARRIINVAGGRKKQLLRSLGVAELAGNPRLEWPELSNDDPPVPLAVVLDDRLDVWEVAAQPCVLQVLPWYWYRDEAARLVSGAQHPAAGLAEASEREIRRMRDAVLQMRSDIFYDINERLRHRAELLVTTGAPERDQVHDMDSLLAGLASVSTLLRSGTSRSYLMPTLASIAAQYRYSATPPPDAEAAAAASAAPVPVVSLAAGFGGGIGSGAPPGFLAAPGAPAVSGPGLQPGLGGPGAAGPQGPGGPLAGMEQGPGVFSGGPPGAEPGFGPGAMGVPGLGAGQLLGPGGVPAQAAPKAPPSLKPVDPRAARRQAAAAGKHGHGRSTSVPAGLGQPPSQFGAAGPGSAPPAAQAPARRRPNTTDYDQAKWLEDLEDDTPAGLGSSGASALAPAGQPPRADAPAAAAQPPQPIGASVTAPPPASGSGVPDASSAQAGGMPAPVATRSSAAPSSGPGAGPGEGPTRPASPAVRADESGGAGPSGTGSAAATLAQGGSGSEAKQQQVQSAAGGAQRAGGIEGPTAGAPTAAGPGPPPGPSHAPAGASAEAGPQGGAPPPPPPPPAAAAPSSQQDIVTALISHISQLDPATKAKVEALLLSANEDPSKLPELLAFLSTKPASEPQPQPPPQPLQPQPAQQQQQPSQPPQQPQGPPAPQQQPVPPPQGPYPGGPGPAQQPQGAQPFRPGGPAPPPQPPPGPRSDQQQAPPQPPPGVPPPRPPARPPPGEPTSQLQSAGSKPRPPAGAPPGPAGPRPPAGNPPGGQPGGGNAQGATLQVMLAPDGTVMLAQPGPVAMQHSGPGGMPGGPGGMAGAGMGPGGMPRGPGGMQGGPGVMSGGPGGMPGQGMGAGPGGMPGGPGGMMQGGQGMGGFPGPMGMPGMAPGMVPGQGMPVPPGPIGLPGADVPLDVHAICMQEAMQAVAETLNAATQGAFMGGPGPMMGPGAGMMGPAGPMGSGGPMGAAAGPMGMMGGPFGGQGQGMMGGGPGMMGGGPGMMGGGPGMMGMAGMGVQQGMGMQQGMPTMSDMHAMGMRMGMQGAPGMGFGAQQQQQAALQGMQGMFMPGFNQGPGMGGAGMGMGMGMGMGQAQQGQKRPSSPNNKEPQSKAARQDSGGLRSGAASGPTGQEPAPWASGANPQGANPAQQQQSQPPQAPASGAARGAGSGQQGTGAPGSSTQQQGPAASSGGAQQQGQGRWGPAAGGQQQGPGAPSGSTQQLQGPEEATGSSQQQGQGGSAAGLQQQGPVPGPAPPPGQPPPPPAPNAAPAPSREHPWESLLDGPAPNLGPSSGAAVPAPPPKPAPSKMVIHTPAQLPGQAPAPAPAAVAAQPPWRAPTPPPAEEPAAAKDGAAGAVAAPGGTGALGSVAPAKGPRMVLLENPVNKLNEIAQRDKSITIAESKGHYADPSNPMGWSFTVRHRGVEIGRGHDKTKKEAKRLASLEALRYLGIHIPMGPAVQRTAPEGGAQGAPAIGPQLPVVDSRSAIPPGTGQGAGGAQAERQGRADLSDDALHRLTTLYTKENCVFDVLSDVGEAPNRRVEMKLTLRNTPHCVTAVGANRRTARIATCALMLTHLGIPYEPAVAAGAGGGGGQGGGGSHGGAGAGHGAHGGRRKHAADSDHEGGGGERARKRHRGKHRSPVLDDVEEVGEEEYEALAAYLPGARNKRPGHGGGQAAQGRQQDGDFMQQFLEGLDDGLGPAPAAQGGAGKGAAGGGAGVEVGGGKAPGGAQGKPAATPPPGAHEESEEEEGELPTEDEGE